MAGKKTIKAVTPKAVKGEKVKVVKAALPMKVVAARGTAQQMVQQVVHPAMQGAAVETLEKVKRNVANQMESTMQNASEQLEKFNRDFVVRLEEIAAFNRSNLDAVVQASNVVAEGAKDVSQAMFSHMQQCMQNTLNTSKAMLSVKSMRELMEIQSEYVKSVFDMMMSDSTKISEIAVRMGSEVAEPINQRVTAVVEKINERVKTAA